MSVLRPVNLGHLHHSKLVNDLLCCLQIRFHPRISNFKAALDLIHNQSRIKINLYIPCTQA